MQEFKPLTSLRGIAALGVLLYHLNAGLPAVGSLIANGYLWVDLFFVLSGFIISHAYAGRIATAAEYRRFLGARFARIYPLHIAVIGVALAIELGRWLLITKGYHVERAAFSEARAWPGLISQVFMLQGIGPFGTMTWNAPAWSISVEFLAYMAFPLLLACVQRTPMLFLIGSIVGIVAWPFIDESAPFYAAPIRCVAEFSLGVLTYRAYRIGAFALADRAAGLTAAAIFALLFTGAPDQIVALIFAPLIIALAQSKGLAKAALSAPFSVYLGEISFALYLTQLPITVEPIDMAARALHTPFPPAWVVIMAALAVASAAHHLVESPARAWLKRRLAHGVPQ